ncbi:hypothetical protein ACFLXO_00440 [Chloroflexota bacterium]
MYKWRHIKKNIWLVTRNVARLFLTAAMGLALLGFFPATAQADTNPVDLVLGGEGATSWNLTNIKPTDNGTKIVELRNIGTRHGFVSIWVSDIISSEGINPESETGNTAEPGELNNYLMLNLSGKLTKGLKLPTTINNLPKSISDPKFIELIPLKAGTAANLTWQWQLPAQTGNDVQGDSISFTINYLLQEFEITNLSSVVTANGTFTNNVTVKSASGKAKVAITANTTGKTAEEEPPLEMWLIDIGKEQSAPSADTTTIGSQYDAGPHGTIFDRPVAITLNYDPADIPERAGAEDLAIAWWDEDADMWVELAGSTVDTLNNTISVPVTHFSRYTIISPAPPPPPPPSGGGGSPPPRPKPPTTEEVKKEEEKEKEAVETVLETNILGEERGVKTEADGTLREPLKLSDPSGRFVIEVDSGSKITSDDGTPLTRLELSLFEGSIPLPGDIVILSPIYRVTGYINELEIPRINFNPPARLTVLYDPRDLPENVFPPFVAYYTFDRGLVPIEPIPGSTVEIGKAKAQISHASLFVVAAKLVPPPPPLPPKFEVSNLTINPRQGNLGQTVTISLEIANDGEIAGSYQLQLKIDGIVRIIKEITIAAKSRETVSFEISNLSVGSHQVEVAGLSGSFRIVSTAVIPFRPGVDWFVLDVSIGGAVCAGLLALYLFRRKL